MKYYKKRKALLQRWKMIKGCSICGYNKCAAALELDHIDQMKKEYMPSQLHKSGMGTMKKELAKCRVLCSNCHREETHKAKHHLNQNLGRPLKGTK